jgi:hypothetical protein
MKLRVSQIQRLITEELTQLIREQNNSNTPVGNSDVGTVVTYYPMTEENDTGDDDYQWDDEKLKFDLDVHDLWNAPSLSIQGDNVTFETDEYDIDIPKKVFKAFAAKL